MTSTEPTTTGTGTSDVADRAPLRGRLVGVLVPACLGTGAVLGWWWSIQMAAEMRAADMGGGPGDMGGAGSMSLSMAAFIVGWAAMMAAMMFPAISPMVKMYAGAASKGAVAPLPFFVTGYLALWTATGIPGYFAWRALAGPLADGSIWTGRLAGAVFLLAGAYQLTPLKATCLRQCRSPISFFVQHGGRTLDRPSRATRLGLRHGLFCLGCCWAIMAILVALGTMSLIWMAALTVVIFLEKAAPHGERFADAFAVAFGVGGLWLLADPSLITRIT